MRTRMYGGVRGRKTKVGGKPTFVFLLLDYNRQSLLLWSKLYLNKVTFCKDCLKDILDVVFSK